MIFEQGDYFVKDGVLFVSLGFFLGVALSLVFEVGNGLVEGILGFLEDDLALGLLGKGGLDLLKRLLEKMVTVASLSALTVALSNSTLKYSISALLEANQPASSQAAAISFLSKFSREAWRLASRSSRTPRTLSARVPALPVLA